MTKDALIFWAVNAYFWGALIYVPVKYALRSIRLYRQALTTPQLVARVASQTFRVLLIYCGGNVAGCVGLMWGLGPNASAMTLTLGMPVAGWMALHLIGHFFRLPVYEVLGDKAIVPHQYRQTSQQIVYEKAMAAYAAIPAPPPETLRLFELAKVDPVYRAALVASYVEAAGKSGWLPITEQDAKRHEAYLDQRPMRQMIVILVAAGALYQFLQLFPWGSVAYGTDWKTATQCLGFVVFGAYFSPTVPTTGWGHYAVDFIVVAPVFYIIGGEFGRYVVTTLIVGYFLVSFDEIAANSQRIINLPWVKDIQEKHRLIQQWGPVGRSIADFMTDGVYSRAESLYRLYHLLSIVSILGFSTTLWLRTVLGALYHMWFSEAGRLYFDKMVRKPQI